MLHKVYGLHASCKGLAGLANSMITALDGISLGWQIFPFLLFLPPQTQPVKPCPFIFASYSCGRSVLYSLLMEVMNLCVKVRVVGRVLVVGMAQGGMGTKIKYWD